LFARLGFNCLVNAFGFFSREIEMSTAVVNRRTGRLWRAGNLAGLLAIAILHVGAFAAVLIQLGWIIPVYRDALAVARFPLAEMTQRSLQLGDYFPFPTFQWLILAVLAVDLVALTVLYRWNQGRIIGFGLYSNFVLALAIGFLVWNSIALCLGTARI
jgi:hypothetical protein